MTLSQSSPNHGRQDTSWWHLFNSRDKIGNRDKITFSLCTLALFVPGSTFISKIKSRSIIVMISQVRSATSDVKNKITRDFVLQNKVLVQLLFKSKTIVSNFGCHFFLWFAGDLISPGDPQLQCVQTTSVFHVLILKSNLIENPSIRDRNSQNWYFFEIV
jgi:hypothetical protein